MFASRKVYNNMKKISLFVKQKSFSWIIWYCRFLFKIRLRKSMQELTGEIRNIGIPIIPTVVFLPVLMLELPIN